MNAPLTLEEVVRLRDLMFSWQTIDSKTPEYWRTQVLNLSPKAEPLTRSNLFKALDRLRLQICNAQLADEDIDALRVHPDNHRRLDMLWARWRGEDD